MSVSVEATSNNTHLLVELIPSTQSLRIEGAGAVKLPKKDWDLVTFLLEDRQREFPGKYVLWEDITRFTSIRSLEPPNPSRLNRIFSSIDILKREEDLYKPNDKDVKPGLYVGGLDQRPRYFVHNVKAVVKDTKESLPIVRPLRLVDRIRLVRKSTPAPTRRREPVDVIKWGGDPLPMRSKIETNHLPPNLIPSNLWPGLLLEVVSSMMIQSNLRHIDYYTLLHTKFGKKLEEWTGVGNGSSEFNACFVDAFVAEWHSILNKAEGGKPLTPMERRITSMFRESSDEGKLRKGLSVPYFPGKPG